MKPFIKNKEFKGSYEPDKKCSHRNSKVTDRTCSDGCCDYYKCLDCGKVFIVECPD